ncbi:MAG: methionyl-tRNA formyltransferase [Chloroflexota bacterium]
MAVRVVFMGSDSFSLPILEALFAMETDSRCRVDVAGVVTQPDRPAGRGRRAASNVVKNAALARGTPVLQPVRLRSPDEQRLVATLDPHLIVVASYGQIVPRALLDLPVHKCVNVHPSLLPLYRGPSPVVAPLLAGDLVTGVSLMLMSARMDAGPIIAQVQIRIREGETAGELESRLAHAGADLLRARLPDWIAGRVEATPQEEALATYTTKVTKDDGRLDWTQPASQIVRRVRAYNPWPSAYTFWESRQLRILRAHRVPGDAEPGEVTFRVGAPVAIGTGDELLAVEELQLAGSRPMSGEVFMRGRRDFLGATLTPEPT